MAIKTLTELEKIDARLKEISDILRLGRNFKEELTLKNEANELLDKRALLKDS